MSRIFSRRLIFIPIFIFFLILSFSFTPSASSQTWNADAASLRIDVGMTEEQAINRIGWRPNRAEVVQGVLRIIIFGPLGNRLEIHLVRREEVWVIQSWSVR